MAHRDFVARRGVNKKKGKNKNILIGMMIAVVFAFGIGLYFLKNKTEEKVVKEITPQTEKTQPKSILPNRPEEVWSYIKALETRTVPVDDKPSSVEKNMRLTEEQRKILLAMEEEQKQAELARSKAAETQATTTQQAVQQPTQPPQQVVQQVVQPQAKPQVVEAKKTTSPKEEKKTEQIVKSEPQKKPELVPQPQPQPQTPQPTSQQTSNNGERRYGLQCGAFKNKAQADALQAKLTALGLNARVNASADWNRVVVGPAGDRNAAVKMQEKAKSVINCVVIGM